MESAGGYRGSVPDCPGCWVETPAAALEPRSIVVSGASIAPRGFSAPRSDRSLRRPGHRRSRPRALRRFLRTSDGDPRRRNGASRRGGNPPGPASRRLGRVLLMGRGRAWGSYREWGVCGEWGSARWGLRDGSFGANRLAVPRTRCSTK
jgi:hypothetical protein